MEENSEYRPQEKADLREKINQAFADGDLLKAIYYDRELSVIFRLEREFEARRYDARRKWAALEEECSALQKDYELQISLFGTIKYGRK
jgi:hypothetical protein